MAWHGVAWLPRVSPDCPKRLDGGITPGPCSEINPSLEHRPTDFVLHRRNNFHVTHPNHRVVILTHPTPASHAEGRNCRVASKTSATTVDARDHRPAVVEISYTNLHVMLWTCVDRKLAFVASY